MAKKCFVCLLITGFVLLAVGVVTLFGFPPLFKTLLNKNSYLVPGSQVYDGWQNASQYPLYMNYYFFDITNVDELLEGADPVVNQTGRLSYREYQVKYDLNETDDALNVYYYNNHVYVYDAQNSEIPEDHVITTANIVMWTIWNTGTFIENLAAQSLINSMWKSGDANAMNYASPFYEVEVGDLLWGYYDNQLLVNLNSLSGSDAYPTTFGLQFNDSADGHYEVNTGKHNDNKMRGNIEEWNDSPVLPYWNSESCNMLNGTDGTVFRTFVNEDDPLYVFDSNLCRSIFLLKSGHETIKGIDTTRFVATEEVFQVDFEDNICYCVSKDKDFCIDGILDVSACQRDTIKAATGVDLSGLNVVLSSPNFLYANLSEIHVDGVHPDPALHQTYLNVNLESGLPVEAAKRIQVNTILTKRTNTLASLKKYPKSPKKIIPIFWAEEHLPVSDDLADQVYDAVVMPTRIVDITSYVLIGLGVIFLIIAVLIMIFADRPNHEESTPLVTKHSPKY